MMAFSSRRIHSLVIASLSVIFIGSQNPAGVCAYTVVKPSDASDYQGLMPAQSEPVLVIPRAACFVFLPNGKALVAGNVQVESNRSGGDLLPEIRIISLDSGEVLGSFGDTSASPFHGDVIGLTLAPNGSHLAAIVRNAKEDRFDVIVWKCESGKLRHSLRVEGNPSLRQLAFSADASELFVADGDGVNVVSVADGSVLRTVDSIGGTQRVAVSPDGRWMSFDASKDDERQLVVYDLREQVTTHIERYDSKAEISSLVFSATSDRLAIAGRLGEIGSAMELLDPSTGNRLLKKDRLNMFPYATVSPDGRFVACTGIRRPGPGTGYVSRLTIWNARSGEELAELRFKFIEDSRSMFLPMSAQFSTDGKQIALSGVAHILSENGRSYSETTPEVRIFEVHGLLEK